MNDDQRFLYNSDAEIESLARRFETCELQPDDLPHCAHLAMSVWYFMRLPEREATERNREALLRFVRHHNLKVYNETITLFWIKLLCRFVEDSSAGACVKDVANEAIKRFGNSRIIFDYYTKELLMSEEARLKWIEPDLKPLDF